MHVWTRKIWPLTFKFTHCDQDSRVTVFCDLLDCFMCVNDVNCYLIWQNNSPSVRWSARGLNASLCGVTAAALAVRFSVAWTRCILGSRNSRSYAFIAFLPILSCNDGRVGPIIISACMHKFRIIRVKLSSHSLLVGVMHSPTGPSLFGMFL